MLNLFTIKRAFTTWPLLTVAVIFGGCSQPEERCPVVLAGLANVDGKIDSTRFVGIDVEALHPTDRAVLTMASEDFSAVLVGEKPIHAMFDEEAPLPSDGGTTYYVGNGYRLTILQSLSVFGGFDGIAYGPILKFDENFAPGNTSTISDIRVFTAEGLHEHLSH